MVDLDGLRRIAEVEFASIVKDTIRIDFKLRVILLDNSFVDIFLSEKLPNKFGFHWERMDLGGTIYRYDNVPDQRWKNLATFLGKGSGLQYWNFLIIQQASGRKKGKMAKDSLRIYGYSKMDNIENPIRSMIKFIGNGKS